MERTDEQLARAAQRGDTRAFGFLVERMRSGLIAHIAGLAGNREDAEELAQETLLLAWQKIGTLRAPDRVGGWIYRIAYNLTVRRRGKTWPRPLDHDPPCPAVDDAAATAGQRQLDLLAAIARLSEPHREVVARKHFAGQTGETIAHQLGVPLGTVRSRLSRAYAELRTMLVRQESD